MILSSDDYCMGMAFFCASGSAQLQAAVIAKPVIYGHSEQYLDYGVISTGLHAPIKGAKGHFIHAEINALNSLNSKNIQDPWIYLTHTPCYECSLALMAASIKKVVYFPSESIDERCIDLFKASYCTIEQFSGNLNWMRDYMKTLENMTIFDHT